KTIADPIRRRFAGMVTAVDEGIGNITRALQVKGMLQDSVIIVTTDNGGPTHECAAIGASNWPLRGGKCSIWEGGTRGTGLVYAPGVMTQGFTWTGLMHAADWLPSLVEGVAMEDAAKIPDEATLPLDGVNLWHALLANQKSPRNNMYYGIWDATIGNGGPALRNAEGWKLIVGGGGGTGDWPRPPARNFISNESAPTPVVLEDAPPGKYLLFNLNDDPSEHKECSSDHPEIAQVLLMELRKQQATSAPQATGDKSCPPLKKRKVLGPWCDKTEVEVVV
ncbi:Arsb, partial [Symbiodinium pilosum]